MRLSILYPTIISYRYNMNSNSATPQTSRVFKRQQQTQPIHEDSELRSQLLYQSRQEGTMSTSELLDSIEEQIKQIQGKLITISERRLSKSLTSQEHAQLEDERRSLKKDLIDLDYQHKLYCERLRAQQLAHKPNSKGSRQSKANEKNIPELQPQSQSQYMEGSRKIEESLQQMRKNSKERADEYKKIFGNPQVQNGDKEQSKVKAPEKSQYQLEQELILAQQRSRLAELELQLASESLRRSREVQLQVELESLRLRTALPLSDYSLPGSYYISPYSSLYRPYLGLYPELTFL